jgi:hypothetical protein
MKATTDPKLLCYCFGFTGDEIRDEILTTGRSTIQQRIAAEVKAGKCDCERLNPQGSCCLGNVAAFIKGLQLHNGKS